MFSVPRSEGFEIQRAKKLARWRSSSMAIAVGKSGCQGASRKVVLIVRASSRGTSAAWAAKSTASFASDSSGTHRQASPTSRGAGAVDALAEHHHRGGGLRSDGPLEHPGVTATRVQPDAGEA